MRDAFAPRVAETSALMDAPATRVIARLAPGRTRASAARFSLPPPVAPRLAEMSRRGASVRLRGVAGAADVKRSSQARAVLENLRFHAGEEKNDWPAPRRWPSCDAY